jgi:hypothetical protein
MMTAIANPITLNPFRKYQNSYNMMNSFYC